MSGQYSNTAWYLVHALLGAVLGAATSVIFLTLYYDTEYTLPVSDALRFKNAFYGTLCIIVVILIILYHRTIREWINVFNSRDEDEDESE